MPTTTITSMTRGRFLNLIDKYKDKDVPAEPTTRAEQVERRQLLCIAFICEQNASFFHRMVREPWIDLRLLNSNDRRTYVVINGMAQMSDDEKFLRAFIDGDVAYLRHSLLNPPSEVGAAVGEEASIPLPTPEQVDDAFGVTPDEVEDSEERGYSRLEDRLDAVAREEE